MKKIYFLLLISITFELNLIKYEEIDKISIIKFNNPSHLNKFDIELLIELDDLLKSIDTQKNNVLVITGEGDESFSIGGRPEDKNNLPELEKEKYSFLITKIFEQLENFPLPVIALVNGFALREGFELALCCDFIICSEKAIFGFREENEQILYEFEKPERLLKNINQGISKKIILIKDFINPYEALKIGLANYYYPKVQIFEEGINLAKIIAKNSKQAVLNSKKSINEGAKIINAPSKERDEITFLISVQYETRSDERLYIIGNNTDFGNWTEKKFKMDYTNGYNWKTRYKMKKNSPCIQYKFVCYSDYLEKWESGENRLLCPNNLEMLPKTLSGAYKLDLIWNHFQITFNLHYPIVPPNTFMQINLFEAPNCLELCDKNEKKTFKMEFNIDKKMPKNGHELSSLWSLTFTLRNSILNKNYLDFEYKYSLFDIESNSSFLEREPNRKLRILLNEKEVDKKMDPNSACFLLKNSNLELLDVNFVAKLDFDRIGDENIFVGTYLQNEEDFEIISKKGINAIINVQTDKDLEYRKIDINSLNKYANKYGIEMKRYPIEDFNKEELYNKIKGAADLLNELIKEGKTVYIHCTAGIGRSPSIVAIYLILYKNYSIRNAMILCKKSRPKISPVLEVINEIVKIYNTDSEL